VVTANRPHMASIVSEPEQDGAVAHEPPGTDARRSSHLARGRAAYHRRAWQQAFDELTAADRDRHQSAANLEQLALPSRTAATAYAYTHRLV
jgi:hypothetical protein